MLRSGRVRQMGSLLVYFEPTRRPFGSVELFLVEETQHVQEEIHADSQH